MIRCARRCFRVTRTLPRLAVIVAADDVWRRCGDAVAPYVDAYVDVFAATPKDLRPRRRDVGCLCVLCRSVGRLRERQNRARERH